MGNHGRHDDRQAETMDLPLFPLNQVLFPGMVLPLHIFEPRYQEMMNRCLEGRSPFGVVLIKQGSEVGAAVEPHKIGTAARISRVERLPDGRMNVVTVGTQRFRVLELDHSHSYLSAKVAEFPAVNGNTRLATELAHRVRPQIAEYVALLSKASQNPLKLDRLPDDPTALAFLVSIALQVNSRDKQALLSLAGVPEMLAKEHHLLSRELLLTRYMVDTQQSVMEMSTGPTGYIFPN